MDVFITYRQALDFPDAVAPGTPDEMSVADFGRVLDFLAASNVPTCLLTGNEPTLHRAFADLLVQAQKKRILPIVDTAGVIDGAAVETLQRTGVAVDWRLYHPDLYPAGQWQAMKLACRAVRATQGDRLRLAVMLHDPAKDFTFAVDFVRELDLRAVLLRPIASPADPSVWQSLTAVLSPPLSDLVNDGVSLILGCGLVPCSFRNEMYGRFAKQGIGHEKCLPMPGVLPNLRVYHCHATHQEATEPLAAFRNYEAIREHFFSRHGSIQNDLSVFGPACGRCVSFPLKVCYGPCLLAKQANARREVETLDARARSAPDPASLLRLGIMYAELQQPDRAEAELRTAIRMDPAGGAAHLVLARLLRQSGRNLAAEDEYRQAQRLMPDNPAVAAEVDRFVASQGMLARARHKIEKLKDRLESQMQDDTRGKS